MNKKNAMKKLQVIIDKYFDVACQQVLLKGLPYTMENVTIQMLSMNERKINPLDYPPNKR